MKKHTPEPWEYASDTGWITDADHCIVCNMTETYVNDQPREEANAERIVACVNACKGTNPEAVPDLLEALREMIPHVLHYASMPLAHSDAHKHAAQARAALAKATNE